MKLPCVMTYLLFLAALPVFVITSFSEGRRGLIRRPDVNEESNEFDSYFAFLKKQNNHL